MTVDGKVYRFQYVNYNADGTLRSDTGMMLTGWQDDSYTSGGVTYHKWLYFGTDGVRVSGWQKIGGKWYYFNSDGIMQTGLQHIKNDEGIYLYYYFGDDGAMRTGWYNVLYIFRSVL